MVVHCIREELAKACGGRYYRKSDGSALGELRFEYPLDWLKTREGQSALNFFFHSDCDGDFSEAQIHAFAKFLRDNHARINVKKHSRLNGNRMCWTSSILCKHLVMAQFIGFLRENGKKLVKIIHKLFILLLIL